MPYLFAHFKEKTTVDGEQVYFAVSRDGFLWEEVNRGRPALTCDRGAGGCRDIEIVRLRDGGFVIIATDLCIVKHMDENCNVDWSYINSHGSRNISVWRGDTLTSFGGQETIPVGREDFGCVWAPEVFYDGDRGVCVVHFSSTTSENGFKHTQIYRSETRDFKSFSRPELFFSRENGCLDSHLRKIGDRYFLFYKNCVPGRVSLATSDSLYGEYEDDGDFNARMEAIDMPGAYEAPTTFVLPDGRWCLMADFFGCPKPEMGYRPYVSPAPGDAHFSPAPDLFSFPYGFKHGGVIEIDDGEYEELRNYRT